MLNLEKVDIGSLESILNKVQKTHHFFKALREIAEENRKTQTPTFLSQEDVSVILGFTCSHLAILRHRGTGPTFRKVGKSISYDIADLFNYIDSCRHASTAEDAC